MKESSLPSFIQQMPEVYQNLFNLRVSLIPESARKELFLDEAKIIQQWQKILQVENNPENIRKLAEDIDFVGKELFDVIELVYPEVSGRKTFWEVVLRAQNPNQNKRDIGRIQALSNLKLVRTPMSMQDILAKTKGMFENRDSQ